MKRTIVCFLAVLVATSPLLALDLGVDVRELDPEAIVADGSNRLVDGWVRSTDYIQYYGNNIMLNASVKKSDHSQWYIFYTAPEDHKAFQEFLSDVLAYYAADALAVIPGADGSEYGYEIYFLVYLKTGGSFTIYAKTTPQDGLCGFGVTQIEERDTVANASILQGELSAKFLYPLSEFDPQDWRTNIAYISDDLVADSATFDVSFKGEASELHYYSKTVILRASSQFTPLSMTWADEGADICKRLHGVIEVNGFPYAFSSGPSEYSAVYTPCDYVLVHVVFSLVYDKEPPEDPILTISLGTP